MVSNKTTYVVAQRYPSRQHAISQQLCEICIHKSGLHAIMPIFLQLFQYSPKSLYATFSSMHRIINRELSRNNDCHYKYKYQTSSSLKGEFKAKKYSFKWTFMFNKVAYFAWKWQFMSNKYDVWRFNSRTRPTVVYTECLRSAWDMPTIKYAIAFAKNLWTIVISK